MAIALMIALIATPVQAKKDKNARKELDTMSAKLTSCGGIKAQFTATAFIGTDPQGRQTGTFLTDGKRFQMHTSEVTTWFDGTTQWSYFKSTDEVNVANPTQSELQALNPYAFLSIYKKGFDYTIQNTTYQGKTVNEIRLTAEKKNADIQRIILTVDKTTHLPLCVRILQGKNNWTRININSFVSGQKYGSDTFKFNKAKYPKAEIIDLR